MLLKNISHKVKADIARTNKGEKKASKHTPAHIPEDDTPKHSSSRKGSLDPTKLKTIPDDFFINIVKAQDNLSEEKRHNTGYTHLSELLKGICVRQKRFADEADTPQYESVTGGHRVMWRIGRAVESHIRESYIKGVKFKGVIGGWECKCGQTTYEGLHEPTHKACPFCRTAPYEYKELKLFDHEFGITGSPDMVLLLSVDNLEHVVEIKSMNPEDFDELEQPKPDHVYQGAGYRRLLRKAGKRVSDKILVVYCTKKFMFGSPYKSFTVDATQPQIESVLDGMWEKAAEIREARKQDIIPARTECSSPSSPQAKKCPFATDCFMRK